MDWNEMIKQAELSQAETKMVNSAVYDRLGSGDPALVKEAVDAVSDYTRTKVREEGFLNQILPGVPITNSDLDRMVHTDKPVVIVDKEPGSPAAVSVPFATLPTNMYIRGSRYPVMLERIQTVRFSKDTDELRTWIMDIRQVLSDNAIKDMLAEEDGKFIRAVKVCCGGAAGTTVATSGTVQWQAMGSTITRDGLWDMMKILRSTPSHLDTVTALCNNITILDVAKFDRSEMGGDMSQDIMQKGWSYQTFLGVKWLVTIKTEIIADGDIYHFADPKFLGKHYELEATTMYVKREGPMLEFYAYKTAGATIGHTSSVGIATFLT